MLHDPLQEHHDDSGDDRDEVNAVDVQILLSWFFETSDPFDYGLDVAPQNLPRAA